MAPRKARVLVGFVWDGKSGGVDAYLFAFARIAAEEGLRLDFLTNEYSAEFAAELADMGHGLFEIATLHDRASQRATIERLQRENGYDAAYLNVSTALMYPIVRDVRRAGVPFVVVHAHAAGNDQVNYVKRIAFDVANRVLQPFMRRAADVRLACSRDAGRWLFGSAAVAADEVRVIPNPVDVERCAFDEEVRARKRDELGVGDRLVVGSVTAMKEVKNPFFLVDVFAEFLKLEPCALLVAVGGGELEEKVAHYAEERLPAGSYRLLGKREDVHELLQAFDAFVLPSRKEGLSIAAIEAQASGLPCLLSDGVPEEAAIIPALVHRMPLKADARVWAEALRGLMGKHNADADGRGGYAACAAAAGYSLDAPRAVVSDFFATCRVPPHKPSLQAL